MKIDFKRLLKAFGRVMLMVGVIVLCVVLVVGIIALVHYLFVEYLINITETQLWIIFVVLIVIIWIRTEYKYPSK